MSWTDFSDAEEQQNTYEVIPRGTPLKVILKIRPGGADYDGCPSGLATRSSGTGAVYLDCEATVMGGKYNKRRIWFNIGLHSAKGPKWGQMGRSMIRAILESARGVAPEDKSDKALKARQIKDLGDLQGMEFCAFADVEKSEGYDDKNVIKNIVPVTHKDYRALMAGSGTTQTSSAADTPIAKADSDDLPDWAKAS